MASEMTTGSAARLAEPDEPAADIAPVELWEDRQPSRAYRFWRRYRPLLVGAAAIAVFLVAVELLAPADSLFLARPSAVWSALVEMFRTGEVWEDLRVSGYELAAGFGLGAGVGITLGVLMGWYKLLGEALDPFVAALYATPRIALTPLIIVWLGIGTSSKIAIVFLSCVVEILVNTTAGVRATDENLIKAARSFGASDLQVFRTVALPAAVPFVLTGLRLAVGRALIGVVVGELFAAQAGIGHQLSQSASRFQTENTWAYIAILAVAGMLLVQVFKAVERHFDAWRHA
ncbi:MAG TPA: ABC transporter permease [Acidimicrobiales bacterium]